MKNVQIFVASSKILLGTLLLIHRLRFKANLLSLFWYPTPIIQSPSFFPQFPDFSSNHTISEFSALDPYLYRDTFQPGPLSNSDRSLYMPAEIVPCNSSREVKDLRMPGLFAWSFSSWKYWRAHIRDGLETSTLVPRDLSRPIVDGSYVTHIRGHISLAEDGGARGWRKPRRDSPFPFATGFRV